MRKPSSGINEIQQLEKNKEAILRHSHFWNKAGFILSMNVGSASNHEYFESGSKLGFSRGCQFA